LPVVIRDQVLAAVARRLEKCVRRSDTGARVGGDADSLVKQADIAMCRVKEKSKNSFGFYLEESASAGPTGSHL
jgi:GGDEF domain-containing protein